MLFSDGIPGGWFTPPEVLLPARRSPPPTHYLYTFLAPPFHPSTPQSPSSFENVRTKWLTEIKQNNPSAPIVLVGTKMDLRTNGDVVKGLAGQSPPRAPVSTAEGEKLAAELGFAKYLECSSLTQVGLKAVFDAAIQAGMAGKEKPEGGAGGGKEGKGKKCTIM